MIGAPKTLLGQIIAYAIGGGGMTALHALVYWLLAQPAAVAPYVANLVAALVAGYAGFELHSRWTFGASAQGPKRSISLFKYAIVCVMGFALNSFWVWLIVTHMKMSVEASILPMILISPWVAFALNRLWTFRARD